MTTSLAEIPLIDRQRHIKAEVELILAQEGGYASYYSLVETSAREESVQSLVQQLLVSLVPAFQAIFGFCSVLTRLPLMCASLVLVLPLSFAHMDDAWLALLRLGLLQWVAVGLLALLLRST